MKDYQKSKVYKLIIPVQKTTLIYVGSTVQPLKDRLSGHKTRPKGVVKYLLENLVEYSAIVIQQLEHYPCREGEELKKREQYWINNLNPECNLYNAYPMTMRRERYDFWCERLYGRKPKPKVEIELPPTQHRCELCQVSVDSLSHHRAGPKHYYNCKRAFVKELKGRLEYVLVN